MTSPMLPTSPICCSRPANRCRSLLVRAAIFVISAAASAGCHTTHNPPPAASATTTTSPDSDERQLRDLYTQYVTALGRHDTAEQIRLTCTQYQAGIQRRADGDPILNIDFFGPPEQVRRLGLQAAADKFQTALAPASRQAVQALVQAIIDGDEQQYRVAVQRVELEGSSATIDRIDNIDIAGDTATVRGAFTVKMFTRPPEVIEATNQALREAGQWKDCTPPRRR